MRFALSIAATLSLMLGSLTANTAPARPSSQNPVYAVAAAEAGLAHDPAAWVGRTVLLRGRLLGCPYRLPGPCASWQPAIADPGADPRSARSGLPVILVWQRHPSVPLSRAAVQRLRWGEVGTYRVQLWALGPGLRSAARGYYGLLEEAAP